MGHILLGIFRRNMPKFRPKSKNRDKDFDISFFLKLRVCLILIYENEHMGRHQKKQKTISGIFH